MTPAYYTDAGLTRVYIFGDSMPYMIWNANGYHLPTEAPRRGLSGKRFPWGNTITESLARANGAGGIKLGQGVFRLATWRAGFNHGSWKVGDNQKNWLKAGKLNHL